MYQTIYIDVVFITNFLMDYMLLRLVGKFLHLGGKRLRCMAAAVFGAFVSCLLLYVPFKIIPPVIVLIHGSCAFFMAGFAFRLKKRAASCKDHPGNVSYSLCGRRYLSGSGNRKDHDCKNLSAFSGRDIRRILHTDLCGRCLPAWKKKHLSGDPDISGKTTAVIRPV